MSRTSRRTPPAWWAGARVEVNKEIKQFNGKVKQKLDEFALAPLEVIARKNPFLFRLRAKDTPREFIDAVLNAFLSSSEETMFGNLLEKCAEIICRYAKRGRKSATKGIDIEYTKGNTLYAIQVKSSPQWGNSSQKEKLVQQFNTAKRTFSSNQRSVKKQIGKVQLQMVCVEGHSYGKSDERDEGTHLVWTGPAFWMQISGWDRLAAELMKMMGKHASNGLRSARQRAKQAGVKALKDAKVVTGDGHIDWRKLYIQLSGV